MRFENIYGRFYYRLFSYLCIKLGIPLATRKMSFSRCNGNALMQSQPRLCLHTQCIFLRTVCMIRWGKIERRVGGTKKTLQCVSVK